MRPGLEYFTRLPLNRVVEIIRFEVERMGYSVEDLRSTQKCFRLRTRFKSLRSCLQALVLRLPTEVDWEVETLGKETRLYCDPKITGLQRWVLISSCIVFAACYYRGIGCVTGDFAMMSVTDLSLRAFLLAASLILIFFNYAMLLAGSVSSLDGTINKIRLESIELGSHLSEKGTGNSPRHVRRWIVYLSFCVLVLMGPILLNVAYSDGFWQTSVVYRALMGLLVFLALVLSFALLLLLRNPGFGLRLSPGLAGLAVAVSVLLLFCAQLPFIPGDGKLTLESVERLEAARDYLNHNGSATPLKLPNGTLVSREEASEVIEKCRYWAWATWSGTALLILMAAGALLLAVHCALQSYPYLYQLAKQPDCPSSQAAIGAHSFLSRFRVAFSLVWVLLAVWLLWAVGELAVTTSYCLSDRSAHAEPSTLNTIEVSSLFAALILDTPRQAPTVSCLIHGCWTVYVSACWFLLFLSVASFPIQRLIAVRRSCNQTCKRPSEFKALAERVTSIWGRRFSSPAPALVLFHDALPIAQARRAGLLSGRTAIEISTCCLDLLEADELDAVLAHELAHCAAKHCLVDDVLRILGRCTFVGDGYVRMLQDSFGHEMQADRIAVELFAIRADSLKACLWKFRSQATLGQLDWFAGISAVPRDRTAAMEAELVFGYRSLSLTTRVRLGLKLCLWQYFGVRHSGYWHPSEDHRISMLDRMEQDSSAIQLEAGGEDVSVGGDKPGC